MSADPEGRGYSVREIGGVLGFVLVAAALGTAAYGAGGRLAGTGAGAAVSAATAATPDGRTVYAGHCAGCHGAQGQGGVGPALRAAATWTDTQFARAVLRGEAPTRTLGAVMPRFADVGLDGTAPTDAQLAALRAFVASLP